MSERSFWREFKVSLAAVVILFTCAAMKVRSLPHVYDLYPGKVGSINWSALQPGDVVLFHAGVYHEKFCISASGTPANPITIMAAPGESVVIDGANATTSPQFKQKWQPLEGNSVILIYDQAHYHKPTDPVDFGFPSNIIISGLEIRNGYRGSDASPAAFTGGDGLPHEYQWGCAGLYVMAGHHIRIEGCNIHDCSNGLFISGGRDNRDISVMDCRFVGNSNVLLPGHNYTHGTYTECRGIVYTDCTFGPNRPGSPGAGCMDRSSGTVVQGCHFWNTMLPLNLTEAQENRLAITADPARLETRVTGNDFHLFGTKAVPCANRVIFFGHDWLNAGQPETRYHLTFENNTIDLQVDSNMSNYFTAFWCGCVNTPYAGLAQTVDAQNNVFTVRPATAGLTATRLCIACNQGIVNLARNTSSPIAPLASWPSRAFLGRVSGLENVVVGASQ